MLLGCNTIRYFEDKSLQRWGNADNQYIFVYFATNLIPPFVLISDTAETSATVQIFDTDDNAIGAAKTVTVTTINTGLSTEATHLKFDGFSLSGNDEGCYYAKIVTNGAAETYYSEVFYWTEDSTSNLKELGLLKITATSSNITLKNIYEIDLTDISYECFIEVNEPNTNQEVSERGNEKPYGDIPVFNTRVIKRKYELLGTNDMLEFLSALRILKTNGTVTFTYKGVADGALNIIFEEAEDYSSQEAIAMSIEYTRDDFISARNEI